ncbi:MAG: IS21 family transposase [Planctomycetes bacterium]|nr:IS21 family transposase [Planctomycetota bacterium]
MVSTAGLLEGAADALPERDVLASLVREHEAAGEVTVSTVDTWRDEIARLRSQGAGPTAIHDHLRVNQPDYSGSLSAIKRLCLRLENNEGPKATDVALRVETPPGDVAQVDFGYAGKRYDPVRGILRKSWVFVDDARLQPACVLRCALIRRSRPGSGCTSRLLSTSAVCPGDRAGQLEGRGGAGGLCVDDDPLIQRSYRELARHYGFQIDPTPPRSPEKKGKVEAGVRYVSGNFLRTWESTDIVQDQAALERWTMEVSDRRVHGTTARRPIELFEEAERSALIPLPKARFEIVIWKLARLHSDSHVQVDGAFYSAPWKHLHQDLWVRCTKTSIAIWLGEEHLWTHARLPRGGRSTVREHLPEHRRDWCERSRSHWDGRAKRIGPERSKRSSLRSFDRRRLDPATSRAGDRHAPGDLPQRPCLQGSQACAALRLPRVPRPEKHPAEGTRPRAPPWRARASVVEGGTLRSSTH